MEIIQNPTEKSQNRLSLFVNSPSTNAILILALIFMFTESYAQVIYGTTSGGGDGTGSIFKVNGDGTGYQETHMGGSNGNNNGDSHFGLDQYNLAPFSNGKLYGVTIGGGSVEAGVLFEYDPLTNYYNERMDFEFYGTGLPLGQLIEYNGKLYGTTAGVAYGIFSFDPATNSFHSERRLSGRSSGLILQNGKFYGMTSGGGNKRVGSIFEYDSKTAEYNVLFHFDRTSTGYYPEGGLTYNNGKLYGVTTTGGLYSQGTLFEYDLTSHHFEKKIDFKDDITGSRPIADLSIYNEKILGMTSAGATYNQGALFEFDLVTGLFNKTIDFNDNAPGGTFKLINGKLYGVSINAGVYGEGVLFSFDPGTGEYTRLIEFKEEDTGGHPFGQLTLYNNTLVGMTKSGGKGNGGVIFKYEIGSDQLQIGQSFNYFPFGKTPMCLVELNTKFYGLTSQGGSYGNGLLFELDPTSFTLTKLYDIQCEKCDGNPSPSTEGKLLAINDKLFGVVTKGGNDSSGVLFEYDVNQKIYSTRIEFNTSETGFVPIGSIALLDQKIFGTTRYGGPENNGVLFEYDLQNSTFQIKQNLVSSQTGVELRLTSYNNSLYGLGSGGSFGNGVISTYNPEDDTFISQHEFQNFSEGIYPSGELQFHSSKLYGITTYGGAWYDGALFEFDPHTKDCKKLLDLYDDGFPQGVSAFNNNKLYLARSGGALYEFNLDNAEFQIIMNIRIEKNYYSEINSLIIHDGDFHTSPATINQVIEFSQGRRKDGKPIDINRSDPQKALYLADSYDSPYNGIQFVSLGFGGSITLAFDQQLYDKAGYDLYVYETSYGNPSFYDYPEQAEIYVSQNGEEWISLGLTNPQGSEEGCYLKLDSEFDLQPSGWDWIQYVKVTDVTNPLAKRRNKNTCVESDFFAFNSASDGFDLDAIHKVKILFPIAPSVRGTSDNSSAIVNVSTTNATALVYPNPASRILSIDLSEEQELAIMEDDFHLEIIDTQGKTWNDSRELMDETWTINHDVSKLNPGMYIARVTNGNVRRHYKFMKN